MLLIYNIGIAGYGLLLKVASIFNQKARLFVSGRKHIFSSIARQVDPSKRPVWFHFASLGEFEQGRPVLEQLKLHWPAQEIIVTFFSPSGYEIRKNYALAKVFYLPLDTAANAEKFVALVNPSLAIFTKYEFWPHYFKALHRKHVPLYLISGIFRPQQIFFKWYGGFYRRILKNVTHFFVQNEESLNLLEEIGIENIDISGDTRFDRVFQNAQHPKSISLVEKFCDGHPVFICGSTWPADEKLFAELVENYPDWKFIIAPHEVDPGHIETIEMLFHTGTVRFSNLKMMDEEIQSIAPEAIYKIVDAQVLIIDNIGMLSSLYQYGQIAYIGGGFGVGIHNTLEAAAFGLPVIFGPRYDKFQEAKELIALGAAKSISTTEELASAFEDFKGNQTASDAAKAYVARKKGATEMILSKLQLNISH